MGLLDDDGVLDNLGKRDLERLAGVLRREGSRGVSQEGDGSAKLRKTGNRPWKYRNRLMDVPVNNRNVSEVVEISLPGYLIDGALELGDLDDVMREALRDHLVRKGKRSWYPRFLVTMDLPS